MGKSKSTVSDARLKARRTSLENKNYYELVNIILRKDSTERKNNAKIQELTYLLKEADKLNEDKANRIFDFDEDMKGMEDKISTKQEQINNAVCEINNLKEEIIFSSNQIERLKSKCNLLRKTVLSLFTIILIIVVIIFIVF